MIGKKMCNFIILYRSPSQNKDDFQAFMNNLEMNLETLTQRNSLLTVAIAFFLTQNQIIGAANTVPILKTLLLKM